MILYRLQEKKTIFMKVHDPAQVGFFCLSGSALGYYHQSYYMMKIFSRSVRGARPKNSAGLIHDLKRIHDVGFNNC